MTNETPMSKTVKVTSPGFRELEKLAIAAGFWFAKESSTSTWMVGEGSGRNQVIYERKLKTRAAARRSMVEAYHEIAL